MFENAKQSIGHPCYVTITWAVIEHNSIVAHSLQDIFSMQINETLKTTAY